MLTNLFRMIALEGATVGDTTSGGGTGTAGGSIMFTVIWIIALAALFYFMMYRPNKKKEKQKKAMLDEMKKGDKVTTIGGIEGRISQIKDDCIYLEVSSVGDNDKVEIKFQKWAIGSVESKNND